MNGACIVESTLNMMQLAITERNVVMPVGQEWQRFGKIAGDKSIP